MAKNGYNILATVLGSALLMFLVLGSFVAIGVAKLFQNNSTILWVALAAFAIMFLRFSRRA